MPDDLELIGETPSGQSDQDAKVKGEERVFAAEPAFAPPNSVLIKLWRGGHLSWHSESSAPVLALIMLLILCGLVLGLGVLTIIMKTDFGDVFKILGNAISAVVGAVVGSSATAVTNSRRKGK